MLNRIGQKKIVIYLIVLGIVVALLILFMSNTRFMKQRDDYVNDVKSILAQHGVLVERIEFHEDNRHYATIDLSQEGLSYREIYYVLTAISNYEYDKDFFSIIFFDITDHYETTLVNDRPALEYRGKVIWIENNENSVDSYICDVPYYGMDESYILCTSLGSYDDYELCRDYAALDRDHQSITYYWYDNIGEVIFEARTYGGKVITTIDYRSGKPIFDSPSDHQ